MGRRYDHKPDELRKIILDACREIITNEGYRNLSSRKLAKKVGYTSGTIFHIFGTLSKLVSEINLNTLQKMLVEMSQEVPEELPPKEHMRLLSDRYFKFVRDNSELYRCVFDYPADEDDENPSEEFTNIIESLFSLVEEPLRKVYPNDPILVKISARSLWSAAYGVSSLLLKRRIQNIGLDDYTPLLSNQLDRFFP